MRLSLPPVVPFRKLASHQNAWADHYGALQVAARYAGLEVPPEAEIAGLWQHGVFGPWSNHTPQLLAYNAPQAQERSIWVAREDQARLLQANGFARARAVGLPIIYTEPTGTERLPGSLLVMPCHTIGGWIPEDRTPYERYADEVLASAKGFERVVVCISPRCRVSGLWLKEFGERGFEIVDGADTRDSNALRRMRMLFEHFETVTTNGWGSHIAYALAFGAKVSIHGTFPNIDRAAVLKYDSAWRSNPAALDQAYSERVREQQRAFLEPFRQPPQQAVGDRACGEWLIGSAHRLTPAGMRDVFGELVRKADRPVAPPADGRPTNQSQVSMGPVASPAAVAEVSRAKLPLVLVRSHEFNYSETFIEDHVAHLSDQMTVVYGWPFPRFRRGGHSVLPEAIERRLQQALATNAVTAEIFAEYTVGLAGFLRSCGARTVLLESGLMGAFFHQACQQADLPFVVHFHGVDAFGRELLTQWSPHYRQFFRTAEALVVVSRAMQAQLLRLGAPAERVVLAPYGVAVEVSSLASPASAPPQFLAVGRFVEKKAPYATIQAFTRVAKAVPAARLVMVGDGPLLEPCRQLALRNGIAEAVTFMGAQSRETVSRLMAGSRAFVQHSVTASDGDSEGLPLAILEAGAHGLAVVSTRHAGIPDAVRHDVDGLLVPEKDISGMAAAMLRLAEDAELAASLGRSFRERVKTHYSRRVSLERLQAILQAAAHRQPVKQLSTVVDGDGQRSEASPAGVQTPLRREDPEGAPASQRIAEAHAAIASDRNAHAAYLALGQALMAQGQLAESYCATAEAHRLGAPQTETQTLLQTLEQRGALGEPMVERYRRRAGWRPRRKTVRPRRILIVTNLLPPQEMGGYGRTMWEFGRELLARAHTVRVLTADVPQLERKPTPEHAAFEPQVDRSLRLCGEWKEKPELLPPDEVRAIVASNHRRILAVVRQFRPDAIVAGNLDLIGHFFLAEVLAAGIPVVHRLGNANPGYEAADTPPSALYCVAGCSEWVNQGLRDRGYSIQRYAVIPPGSPLSDYFRAFPPQRRRLRIAFASLLMPFKGAHILVDALAQLCRAGIDFECTLAGDSTSPAYVETLKQVARENGFFDRLHFTGFLSKQEMAALYARSNVLVFPSLFDEPFGKTQIEAMAAGLVVISSGTGGSREIVRHGENGLIFQNGNAADLAHKLRLLHELPKQAQQLADAGQAYAFRYTTSECVDRLEAVIEELVTAAAQAATPALSY